MNSKKDSAPEDFIFIEGLETRCIIGIFGWERKTKQRVRIDLIFPTDVGRAARRDRIEEALNYKLIAKKVLAHVEKSRFHLVESLAESIARLLLEEFGLGEVRIRVSKPGAIRNARDVGVVITRSGKSGRRPRPI